MATIIFISTDIDGKEKVETFIGDFKNNKIEFIDNEQNKNYFMIKDEEITLVKSGMIKTELRFITDETHEFTYNIKAAGLKLNGIIKTKVLIINDKKIEIFYETIVEKNKTNGIIKIYLKDEISESKR